MKKITLVLAVVFAIGINITLVSKGIENSKLSLNSLISKASAQGETTINITEPVNTLKLVITTTTTTAQVELCGDAAASYLGLVSGSISGCITVSIERTVEEHDCPCPGSTC